MKKLIAATLLIAIGSSVYSQGCTVSGLISRDTIICGQSAVLSAYGQGQGIALLSENFNSGSFGAGWSASPAASWNNPCSSGGVDGTTHIWLGNQSPVPRELVTSSFNLSSCVNAGVTICFDMLFAEQGDASPCEGPDEPDEGVYLQYSTNNGTTWTDINYFDPNGGNDPTLVNWNNWCFPVPPAALTANTRFRWFQDNDSGADYDHWGVDNVVIYCNDPSFNIVWTHDGYNHGPVGGVNPNAVAPQTSTTYTVVMSNGIVTCVDSVSVIVKSPSLVVDAGNDTTICSGQCAQLNATAKVIQSPAKTPTYVNNEFTTLATGFGQVTNIGINVTGLNMLTVMPNSITQVCISNVFFFGFGGFPPTQIDIGDLILSLTCPSGQNIILVPANVTSGANNILTGGYNNTCFVPAGSNIASASAPYSGGYTPNQSFNNLAGCTSNGVWELNVQMNTALGFGTGSFSGWSISFNDPEVSYTGNFSWNPTSNMTGSNTLTPTICPTANATTAYTITASDTAGCVTQSDVVNVTMQTCCVLTATATTVQPSCAQSNGSINLTPPPAGSYTYAWNDGNTNQNRTGLAAGSYSVTITSTTTVGCTWDTTIVLNSNSTLNLGLTSTNPTCAGGDGSATFSLSGGTVPYAVTIDTGGAPQTINLPFALPPQTLNGLSTGTVNVSVVDGQGCVASATATLVAPTNCCTFGVSAVLSQPSCGQADGSIALTASNGSGNYTYAWSGGLGSASSVSSISAANYAVTITDIAFPNCFIDTSFSLSNPNAPVIDNVTAIDELCAGTSDGSITVIASGGTGQLSIAWSNGDVTFTTSGLTAGQYDFTVTDANGCQVTGNGIVGSGNGCCNLTVSGTQIDIACGIAATGSIDVTSAGATSAVSYLWNDNATTEDRAGLSVGSYSVTATSGVCTATATFTITQSGSVSVTLQTQDAVCFGTASGEVFATVIGGSQPYSYSWSNGQTSNPISALNAGNYSVTAIDGTGCSGSASAIVSEPAPISVDINPDTLFLPLGGTGQVIVTSQNATNPVYNWSPSFALSCSDCTNPTVSTTQSGQFVVTVSENIGNVSCQATASLVVIVEPHKPIFIPNSFSPNGDGNNDMFQIFGEGIKFFELKIFNRWGEKIYESNNHLQGWDGTYKGKPQEPQVLVYLIDVVYLDDYTDHKMGSLTIIK